MHAGTELRDRGVCWQPRQETAAEEKKLMGKEMEKTHKISNEQRN
jgi:hypothetical protein